MLRVLFPPAKIKKRLFADSTTPHLLGDICFGTSLQSVGNSKENLHPSQLAHTKWHTPAQHTMICGALFSIPVLFHTSSASGEVTFPLKNSTPLNFLYILPLYYFQHFCYTSCSVDSPGVKIHTQPSHLLSFHPRLFPLWGPTFSSFLF